MSSNPGAFTRTGIFPHKKRKKKINAQEVRIINSLVHKISKFDFNVDQGKGRLNPSREKNEDKHRRRKVDEKSCVTFLLGASAVLPGQLSFMRTKCTAWPPRFCDIFDTIL